MAKKAVEENTILEEGNAVQEPAEEATAAATETEPAAPAEAAEAVTEPEPAEPAPAEEPKKPKRTRKKKTEEPAEEAAPAEEAKAEKPGKPARNKSDEFLRERGKAIPKDISEDEAIAYMTSRETFSGAMASQERRNELKNSTRIITRSGDAKVVTLETIRDEEYKDLRGAAQAGRILEGEIIGVRNADPDRVMSPILADIRYKSGAFKVSIPSYLLFNYKEEQYQGEEGMKDLFEAVKKRITGTIDFVPAFVDQDKGICYGDRLRALSMLGVQKYIMPMRGDDTPEIIAGCIVQGRIMAVGRTYVIVDCIGVDVRVPQDELSYLHIGDARNSFTVDSDVLVKILTVGEETVMHGQNKYRLVKATGSIKQACPDMRKKYIDQYQVGTHASAVITYIDDNMHVFCELNGGQIDCLCKYPRGGSAPAVGQKRIVRIEYKDEENMRLFGKFVSN
ncbi:MAG: hypothetical protein IJJ48_01270 [Firmicutes bacterium]|nr:hypothetical protein [Bacillota bacterium]